MLNNMIGAALDLEAVLREQMMLQYENEILTAQEETELVIQAPSWLDEPVDGPDGTPPETDGWMCPRCRSHRCIRMNPGDLEHATFCCAVCGYTFEAASAARPSESEGD